MQTTGPRFTCLTNENIALDRKAELCLQPVIFLSRAFFGEKSVKVYRIDTKGEIKDLPSSNQTPVIHRFCMCILGAIMLIPGTLVGGFLKGVSWCTKQHKQDCDQLDKFLHPNTAQIPSCVLDSSATLSKKSIVDATTEIMINQQDNEADVQKKLNLPNGDVYQGSFLNGAFHGKGTYTWPNGDTYVGDF